MLLELAYSLGIPESLTVAVDFVRIGIPALCWFQLRRRVKLEIEEVVVSAAVRVNMITQSSNTCLEPVSCRARVRGDGRFRPRPGAPDRPGRPGSHAVRAGADAGHRAPARGCAMGAVAWDGDTASWPGIDQDRALCRALEVAARLGLASSYTSDVGARIVERCAEAGVEVACGTCMSMANDAALGDVDAEMALGWPVAGIDLASAPLISGPESALGVGGLRQRGAAVEGAAAGRAEGRRSPGTVPYPPVPDWQESHRPRMAEPASGAGAGNKSPGGHDG